MKIMRNTKGLYIMLVVSSPSFNNSKNYLLTTECQKIHEAKAARIERKNRQIHYYSWRLQDPCFDT